MLQGLSFVSVNLLQILSKLPKIASAHLEIAKALFTPSPSVSVAASYILTRLDLESLITLTLANTSPTVVVFPCFFAASIC